MADHKATESKGNLALPSGLYDWLKQLAVIGLPAAITFYVTVGGIWGWANIQEVAGTLGAANVFLGVLLGISSKSYNNSDKSKDGAINVDPSNEDNPISGLDLSNISSAEIASKGTVTLKVNDVSGSQD